MNRFLVRGIRHRGDSGSHHCHQALSLYSGTLPFSSRRRPHPIHRLAISGAILRFLFYVTPGSSSSTINLYTEFSQRQSANSLRGSSTQNPTFLAALEDQHPASRTGRLVNWKQVRSPWTMVSFVCSGRAGGDSFIDYVCF
jgi:hypothetical protein